MRDIPQAWKSNFKLGANSSGIVKKISQEIAKKLPGKINELVAFLEKINEIKIIDIGKIHYANILFDLIFK